MRKDCFKRVHQFKEALPQLKRERERERGREKEKETLFWNVER